MTDTLTRRRLLATRASPDTGRDLLVEFRARLGEGDGLIVRYVPDREIVTEDGFEAYVALLAAHRWESLELLAGAVLADMVDVLLPRWTEVSATDRRSGAVEHHRVVVEDSQPGWSNPALLARMAPL